MTKQSIILFALLVTACSQPVPPTVPFVQKKTNGGFENAYYVSFAYDTCGDGTTGERYRAALRQKAESCPMPVETRAALSRSIARMDAVMPQKVAAYHAEYGEHPVKSGDYDCSLIVGKPNETLESAVTGTCPAE